MTPNQDHPFTCSREPGRVAVLFEGHEIADSDDVLLLRETDGPPVRYLSRADVAMDFLHRCDKVTRCPHRGEATHYAIYRDAKVIEDVAWSYEKPPPGFGQLAGRIAFHPEHVDFKRMGLTPAETRALNVDDVVRHTDSGAGGSQAEPWTANVSMPDDAAWEGDDIRDDQGGQTLDRPYQGTGSI